MFAHQLSLSSSEGNLMPTIVKILPLHYIDYLEALNKNAVAKNRPTATFSSNTKNAWDGMVNLTSFCLDLNVKALPSSVANPNADIYSFMLRTVDLLNHILPWFHKIEIAITSTEHRTRFTNLFGVFMKSGDSWPCSENGHIDGPLNYYSPNPKKPDSKRGGMNLTQQNLISIISVHFVVLDLICLTLYSVKLIPCLVQQRLTINIFRMKIY
jgi:hypothetical protein